MATDPNSREASCSCGKLRATVVGDPVRVAMCHCFACQARTGSTFGVQARFEKETASVSGLPSDYTRVGESGDKLTYHFCPDCGSTVYYFLESLPDIITIPVGAFRDPDFPEPEFTFYEHRRHDWTGKG